MEAALQVISNLSNVRHLDILIAFVIILGELEVHLIREEVFEEEVHQFGILFLLEVVVIEHAYAATNNQLASAFLVVVDGTDGTVAGVGERP
jgi:uncharacterized membrane protein YfhO